MGFPPTISGGPWNLPTSIPSGIDKMEVLREPNSALYGSDALAGVVSMTTARGITLFLY